MRNGQRTDDGNDREVKTSRPEAMRRADSERFREFALNTPRAIHLHTVPRRHRHASQSPWNLRVKEFIEEQTHIPPPYGLTWEALTLNETRGSTQTDM